MLSSLIALDSFQKKAVIWEKNKIYVTHKLNIKNKRNI